MPTKPKKAKRSTRTAATLKRREDEILVELCQQHGYTFMTPKKSDHVVMVRDGKTGMIEPQCVIHVMVPPTSSIAALVKPPGHKAEEAEAPRG